MYYKIFSNISSLCFDNNCNLQPLLVVTINTTMKYNEKKKGNNGKINRLEKNIVLQGVS